MNLVNLPGIDTVFQQPTLTHLCVRNVDFDFGMYRSPIWLKKSNSIQCLEFISCEILCSTLAYVLEIHKVLKRLCLKTTRCIWDGWNDEYPHEEFEGKARWLDVVRAISMAKLAQSLEHLELTSFNRHTVIPALEQPLDMSDFIKLRSLRLDTATTITPHLFTKSYSGDEVICNGLGNEMSVTTYRRMSREELSIKNVNGNACP